MSGLALAHGITLPAVVGSLQTTTDHRYGKSMPICGYAKVAVCGWRGWVRADLASWIGSADPLESLLSLQHEKIKQRDGVTTYRMPLPIGDAFVRHDSAPKRGWGGCRSVKTLRIHAAMARSAVRVAAPYLALYRAGEQLFAAEAIDGENFVYLIRDAADDAVKDQLLEKAAEAVAGLHRCGYAHGDMLPGNMILRHSDQELVFIDNERTRRLPGPIFDWFRRRNIMQMVCRLIPRHRYRHIRRFLIRYYAAYGVADGHRRREQCAILRRARARRRLIDDQRRAKGKRIVLESRRSG